LQNKPDAAANLLLQSIRRFSAPDARDYQVWDWIMQTVKPDTVIAVLQKAHDERPKPSNVGQGAFLICCMCPHLTWASAIVVDQTGIASPDLESGVETRFSIVMGGLPLFFHSTRPTFVKSFR
jgi:hypothetical protein